jgi:replicative DNA helicase
MKASDLDLAERSLLGALLRDNDAVVDVMSIVTADDFRADADRKTFLAVVALWQEGKPVDPVTLADRLHLLGQIEDVGGYGHIAELYDQAPTGANAVYYAGIVRERSVLRQLEAIGQEITRDARGRANSAEALLERAERSIFRIAQQGVAGQVRPISVDVGKAMDRIDARADSGSSCSGIPTG